MQLKAVDIGMQLLALVGGERSRQHQVGLLAALGFVLVVHDEDYYYMPARLTSPLTGTICCKIAFPKRHETGWGGLA